MSELPPFVKRLNHPYGVLPEGIFPCDTTTFRFRFVEAFPQSETRASIYAGFEQLRHDAEELGLAGTQWVDGSFVESKLNPNDIDVVTFCDYDHLNELDEPGQQFARNCLNGRETTLEKYRSHTFLVISCSCSHPDFTVFERFRAYWRQWFGGTRDAPTDSSTIGPPVSKGIVEMIFGDPVIAPQISPERTS